MPVLLLPAAARQPGRGTRRKRDGVDRALAALPDARVRWFTGDHDIHAQHPDELADVMIDMLSGRASSRERARPRILAIMGSGETAPTMAKVHRALFERLGRPTVPAAIIDTPYGFQENADELSARTVEFFATSVGRPVEVATYRSRGRGRGHGVARPSPGSAAPRYVMAGPGSPILCAPPVGRRPDPRRARARSSPAAACSRWRAPRPSRWALVTIPVYEIYKVGEEPRWLDGLDLLGAATGLRAAVVPHYDNAEGGNHDTRFCYMGERRLRHAGGAAARGRVRARRGQPHGARCWTSRPASRRSWGWAA